MDSDRNANFSRALFRRRPKCRCCWGIGNGIKFAQYFQSVALGTYYRLIAPPTILFMRTCTGRARSGIESMGKKFQHVLVYHFSFVGIFTAREKECSEPINSCEWLGTGWWTWYISAVAIYLFLAADHSPHFKLHLHTQRMITDLK